MCCVFYFKTVKKGENTEGVNKKAVQVSEQLFSILNSTRHVLSLQCHDKRQFRI